VKTSASWAVASPNVSLHRSRHAHDDNLYRKRDMKIAQFLPQTFRYDRKEPSSDLVPMVKSKISNFLPMNVPWLKKSRTACRRLRSKYVQSAVHGSTPQRLCIYTTKAANGQTLLCDGLRGSFGVATYNAK
jgi:hypothetical protein